MNEAVGPLLQALQGGGNVALIVSVYVIWRAADRLSEIRERLARIERALDRYMGRSDGDGLGKET